MDLRTAGQSAGVWYKIHTRFGTCEVELNPSPKEFGDLYRKLSEPYARYMGKHEGALPPGVDEDIGRQCIAKAALWNWRNITDDNGEPLAFSAEAALALMDRDIVGDQFRRGCLSAIADLHAVVALEVDGTEKN